MTYRKLRITWSVVWGVAAVLFFWFWVLNYYSDDILSIQLPTRSFSVWHVAGSTAFATVANPDDVPQNEVDPGFGGVSFPGGFLVTFPNWFVLAPSMMLAAAPWIHWSKRFTLRTLLIATTLAAVMLGLTVWSTS